jgi:hypothetical protein
MAHPQVQVVAVSNVYSRLMHFVNKGDIEIGHSHTYDHATLLSSGSVLYEVLDGPDGNTISAKEFVAPGYIFVEKEKYHRITALENNTVCACIHALRTIDEEIIDPSFFIEPLERQYFNQIFDAVQEGTGKPTGKLIHNHPFDKAA